MWEGGSGSQGSGRGLGRHLEKHQLQLQVGGGMKHPEGLGFEEIVF